MSREIDDLKDNPYLLDDEDLLASLEKEYKEAGTPVDQVAAKRNWQAIERKNCAEQEAAKASTSQKRASEKSGKIWINCLLSPPRPPLSSLFYRLPSQISV